jgi:peptidylprolyl isomerase
MITAKKGDTVRVHYTGKLSDGSIFETTKGNPPYQFTIGNNEVIPGFENAVIGMHINEKKNVNLNYTEAYGAYNKDIAFQIDINEFPDDAPPQIGEILEFRGERDEKLIVTVVDIRGSKVYLDGNHPLANQNLTFEIQLLEIL